MPPRAADRIKALQQQRAAALTPQAPPAANDQPPAAPAPEMADVQAHFGGFLDQLTLNRQIQRIPTGSIAPDVRPEMQQPRLLPSPGELMPDGVPAPDHTALVAELVTLGHSLQQQQIQPIVVYPGANSAYPAARYLILVGQRRWTAACLVGLDAIDAVVVEPPTPAERIRIQYAENEDREEFSDMERAWSIQQMKQAMSDASWEAVEERLQLSRTRRHQLSRLLTFSPQQQRLVARLRLQETQLRPLHTAVRNQELGEAEADAVLQRLAEIVTQRVIPHQQHDQDTSENNGPATRRGVDGPTIARLVARARRAAVANETPTPRWIPPLQEQLGRTRQALQRSAGRIGMLSDNDNAELLGAMRQLRDDLDGICTLLERRSLKREDYD